MGGQYDFQKLHGIMSQKFRLHGWGKINYQAYAENFQQCASFHVAGIAPRQ
jgi:hypothetical protein